MEASAGTDSKAGRSRRRRRCGWLWAALRRSGLAATVGIAGLWVASYWWQPRSLWSQHSLADESFNWRWDLSKGRWRLVYLRGPLLISDAFSEAYWGAPLFPRFYEDQRDYVVNLPLWLPLVLIGVPTGLMFYRDCTSVRRRREGLCLKCGYDLRGLPGGSACPECGKAEPAMSA